MPDRRHDDDANYGLVMPFVTVASRGGPHDDASYTCGWECGAIDTLLHALAPHGVEFDRLVRTENVPQLDLIAMRHGYVMTRDDDADAEQFEGWTYVRFELTSKDPDA